MAQRSHRSRTVTEPGSKEQEQQVLLLHQLARMQQDETSVAMPRASQGSPLPLITRLALAVLLIAAIVGGLLLGGMAPNLAPSESGNLAPILEMVNHEPGHPALIVFDYTPALSGVFNPMAQQLFVELDNRDINTLFTSQSPSGLAMANRAAMDGGATDAIDLGFIPGDAAGLRRFGRCIQSSEPCGSLFGQRLDDVSVSQLREVRSIILITGERDSLLSWIEQLNVADTVSVGAIVTPALYPVALPYAASGQLVDVAIATGDMGADGAANTVALSLAQWLAGSAILVGAAYYLIIGIIRKRRA